MLRSQMHQRAEMLANSKLEFGRSTAWELAAGLARGEITSQYIVEASIAAYEASGDENIFITPDFDRARMQAASSDERRAKGKALCRWDGIPLAWKDLFDLKHLRTTVGSAVYAKSPPAAKNAFVVAACDALGLPSLGKTNLSEFALSGLGVNPYFGTPTNPWSKSEARVPGGSSSGSAVAVAHGIVPVSIGTDTAGSARVPAAFCGIAGFKSSTSRHNRDGVCPLAPSFDSIGAFARSVSDLVAIDLIMRGKHPAKSLGLSLEDIEFVIPDTFFFDGIHPHAASVFDCAIEALSSTGIQVRRSAAPLFQKVSELLERHGTPILPEAMTIHRATLERGNCEGMDPIVKDRLSRWSTFDVRDYIALLWERQSLIERLAKDSTNAVFIWPTVAIPPPCFSEIEQARRFEEANRLALRNTLPGSILDMPGVTIPIGFDESGLPLGALISGPSGEDDRVLAAGQLAEQALGRQCVYAS